MSRRGSAGIGQCHVSPSVAGGAKGKNVGALLAAISTLHWPTWPTNSFLRSDATPSFPAELKPVTLWLFAVASEHAASNASASTLG